MRSERMIGKTVHIELSDPPDTVRERLRTAVLPTNAVIALAPMRLGDWIVQYKGKRFVGDVGKTNFKIGFLPAPTRFGVRGSVVVVVGQLSAQLLTARLRPPLFVRVFLAFFALLMMGALVLSFLAPAQAWSVQAVLAFALIFPCAVVIAFFRREAKAAEQALRSVVLGR